MKAAQGFFLKVFMNAGKALVEFAADLAGGVEACEGGGKFRTAADQFRGRGAEIKALFRAEVDGLERRGG